MIARDYLNSPVVFFSGINVIIPEGAISRNQTEEIFIAALRDDKDRPVLLGKVTTHIILCHRLNRFMNACSVIWRMRINARTDPVMGKLSSNGQPQNIKHPKYDYLTNDQSL